MIIIFHLFSLKKNGQITFSKILELVASKLKLIPFAAINTQKNKTIGQTNTETVLQLNKTIWSIQNGDLCPPIPERIDYIQRIPYFLKYNNILLK